MPPGCATAWMRAAIYTAMPTKATAFALNQCPTFWALIDNTHALATMAQDEGHV